MLMIKCVLLALNGLQSEYAWEACAPSVRSVTRRIGVPYVGSVNFPPAGGNGGAGGAGRMARSPISPTAHRASVGKSTDSARKDATRIFFTPSPQSALDRA